MKRIESIVAIASGLMLASSAAVADDSTYGSAYESELDDERYESTVDDDEFEDDIQMTTRPDLVTPMGMALTVGGAFSDYTDSQARSFLNPGGGWEVRALVGSRTHIAVEGAYIGTANNINALGVARDAILLSNGLEGALRLNILTEEWQPYVLGGLGWKHYNVVNTPTNTSNVRDSDDGITVPLGVGVSYRFSNFVADLRGTFKPAYIDDITRTGGADDTALHTYGAQANVGFEF